MSRTLVTLIACSVAMTSLGTAAHAQYYGPRYYGPGDYDRGYSYDRPRYYREYRGGDDTGYYMRPRYDRWHGVFFCTQPGFTPQNGWCKPYRGY
jgi:hypothetical protein